MLSLYRVPALYVLAMRAAYGSDYAARLSLIAARIDRPSTITEVCCGDLALHRHLGHHGLVRSYVGLDQSPAMLRRGHRLGVDVREIDVRTATDLPRAEVVIMQASLYQFHDIATTLLPRLWSAATRVLLIAEPVRNLAQSESGLMRRLALTLTRTTDGRTHLFRYTDTTLLEVYERSGVPVSRIDRTPGGREIVVSSERAG